jgi:DNA polymerase
MGGDTNDIGTAELRSALSWWLEAGVDLATDEQPRNWLKTPAAKPEAATAAVPSPPPTTGVQVPDTLEAFGDWVAAAPDLPFASAGGRRILPAGPSAPAVMLMSDMPPLDCDPGEGPISGDAWLLMRRMLAAIGVDPADAYRASLSCFHSMAGLSRGPELDSCAEMALRHIDLVKPRSILLLGDAACRALLGKSLAAARGHVQKIEGIRTVATFHPAFLIMHPLQKEGAWADLLLLTEDQ